MKTGSRLTIRGFHITDVEYGEENKVSTEGILTVDPEWAKEAVEKEPLIESVSIQIIPPYEHDRHTNTIMDVIPISAKALGKLGEGVTHTLTGVYVLLTGVDAGGRQVCNGGASDGILKDKVAWGMAGTPLESDYLISFDVVVKKDAWVSREGPDAIHRICDRFVKIYREQLRKFDGRKCTETHTFQEEYVPGRLDVVIMKEVSGQGAVYDTHLFGKDPGAFEGSRSIIDMGNMPVMLTPNEFRDGVMRAMD